MKVVGFGDFLIHFSPIMDERFMQANLMQMSFTGAEANVCCALGLWGEDVEFVTRLPKHLLAERGISFLKGLSVKTDKICFGEGRMGSYYLEKGRGIRSSVVIYDRDYSAFTLSKPSDYRFDEILADCDILYVSGITPALSDSLLEATEVAFAEAKARGMKIVYDVNYRPKLASVEKTREIFSRLSGYITHLICNEEHLKMLLDIDSEYGEDESEARLGDISSKAQAMTGIKNIVVTVRRTPSSSRAIFCAAYRAGLRFAMSSVYDLDVVDRVGSGDAFSAGFVYSLLHDFDEKSAVSFAAASCALKHEIINDVNFASVDEIEAVMDKGSFDVRR